jgi:Mlc titration factor MtfA (ptsG expression regulator)
VIARWLRAPWQYWRERAEARALARRAIPDDLWKRTLVRYPFLKRRDPADRDALRRLTSLFLDRKEFSAAGGLRMTNDVVVAIAAQAVLPVLHLGLDRYDGFVGLVVHPHPVRVRRQHIDDAGVQHEYDEELAGEAMEGGPVMLSWYDVRSAGRGARSGGPAYNVVIHEFAHVLDLADGASDGVPLLPAGLPRTEWLRVLHREYEGFVGRVDAGAVTALDAYGAQGEDEFFAVASEAFFVTPEAMKAEHPALYGVFMRFYGQDPAAETA